MRNAGFSSIVVFCQLMSVTLVMLRLNIGDHDGAQVSWWCVLSTKLLAAAAQV